MSNHVLQNRLHIWRSILYLLQAILWQTLITRLWELFSELSWWSLWQEKPALFSIPMQMAKSLRPKGSAQAPRKSAQCIKENQEWAWSVNIDVSYEWVCYTKFVVLCISLVSQIPLQSRPHHIWNESDRSDFWYLLNSYYYGLAHRTLDIRNSFGLLLVSSHFETKKNYPLFILIGIRK